MFLVELPVKPYVKHYIAINFGSPADFSRNKYINERFRRCLIKPCSRWENKYKDLSELFYSSTIPIRISHDDFYRYGWELTLTDTVAFGKIMEHHAKFLMRNMVSFYKSFMLEKYAILQFQQKFGFTEDVWSYESIRKDYYRSVPPGEKPNYTNDLTYKIENILLGNLSKMGTLSHQALEHYDNLKKADHPGR
jgi:hypothetical protein